MNAIFVFADLGAVVAVAIAALFLRRWWYGVIAAAVVTALWSIVWLSSEFGNLFDLWSATREFIWLIVVFSLAYAAKQLVLWSTRRWWRVATVASTFLFLIGSVLYGLATYLPALTPGPLNQFVIGTAEVLGGKCSPETVRTVAIPDLPLFDGGAAQHDEVVLTELPAAYSGAPIVEDARDHFIGPYAAIRTPDLARISKSDPFPSVAVTVVVGERGDVLAVIPTSGPKEFYEQAVKIARQWKFQPFVRDGKPSTVRVGLAIPINSAVRAPSTRKAFPPIRDWSSLQIKVEHEVHGWGGQDYKLIIRGDGSVIYEGHGGVAVIGRHCAVVPRKTIERLVEEFQRADFYSLENRYVAQASDVNSVEVGISFDGQEKSVYTYGHEFLSGPPDAIFSLPWLVAHAVQAQRWTSGNAYTAPSLAAEHWSYSLLYPANWLIVPGVIIFSDDAGSLRDLINAGAPVIVEPLQTLGIFTAIEVAALRGQPEMLRVLLETKAAWGKGGLSRALTFASQTADIELIDLLIARGADPSAQEEYRDKKTALMNAAQGGVPLVVERLLRAKANVKTRDMFGRVALHWAVSWRDENKPTLSGIDRARVVELLVAAGTDVNVRDDDGGTPLMSEWDYGEEGAIALIKLGADVNARDDAYGATPLIACRNPKVTQILLDAGADPYLRDNFGQDAFDHARGTEAAGVFERWAKTHPRPVAKGPKTAR